jgi:arsenate reductase
MSKPSVLFVCVHNAGRSQMPAAFLSHLSAGAVEVRSAGSAPVSQVNPAAVQAMAEVGIDIAAEKPKILTDQAVRESDVVITMGCGATCPFYPGKRCEDWLLDDPAGKDVEAVRPIRDAIRSPRRGAAGRPRRGEGRPQFLSFHEYGGESPPQNHPAHARTPDRSGIDTSIPAPAASIQMST